MTCGMKNISIIDHSIFGDKLSDDHGRYDITEGVPNKRDPLHLGKRGIRLFASKIKTSILSKSRNISRQRHDAGQGQYRAAASRNSASSRVSPRNNSAAGTRRSANHGDNRFSVLADHHD